MNTSSTPPSSPAKFTENSPIPAFIQRWWRGLFDRKFAAIHEILLFILLINAARDGFAAATQSLSVFREAEVFDEVALGYQRHGLARLFPTDWILAHDFTRIVGAVTCLTAVLWFFKRLLPIAPLICAFAHALQVSIHESLMFNYKHQELPGVALLMVYAGVYFFRHESIQRAIRSRTFWTTPIYPAWVAALIIAYMGFQYTYSGITKLWMGGLHAGDGLGLQLLLTTRQLPDGSYPVFSRPILEHRWLATISLTTVVILETGAILAFCIRWLRPIWAFGLFAFHAVVILTLAIPFKMHMAILAWFTLWGFRDLLVRWRGKHVLHPPLRVVVPDHGLGRWVADLVYSVDILGVLKFREMYIPKRTVETTMCYMTAS